ncbi:MAG: SulP family inorganic anion transporter, partial [Actinomycetota bacterium]
MTERIAPGTPVALLSRLAALAPRRADWTRVRPGRDLMAGVLVGLVALPLALGFGVSSGVGAGAGLVTAIVAGVVAAVFGGSRVQVSGPTGAMTVVLLPIVRTHGPDGVLVVGLLAGLILVGLGYAGAGRFIRYVPIPVVEGFTVGIALVIALQQVPAALGVTVRSEQVLALAVRALRAWLADPTWVPIVMTLLVAVGLLAAVRVRPALPGSLLAVVGVTVVNA